MTQESTTLKSILGKILGWIVAPILKFPVFTIFFMIVLLAPTIIYKSDSYFSLTGLPQFIGDIFDWKYAFETFIVIACGIGLIIANKINRILFTIVAALEHIFIYSISLVDTGLTTTFGCHLSPFMLQLLNQTNNDEASDFISTYMLTVKFISCVLLFVLLGVLEYLAYKNREKIRAFLLRFFNTQTKKWIAKGVIALYTLFSIIAFVFIIDGYKVHKLTEIVKVDSSKLDADDNFVFNSLRSFLQFSSEKKLFEKCAQAQEIIEIDSCSFRSENIVLIIGESYDRHHSSLYGYRLKTNPLLEQEKNLHVFSNVISSVNVTTLSFRNFLSFASVEEEVDWYDTPLFPCMLKKAGYNMIFWSNQFIKDPSMDSFDAACGFFYHPSIEPNFFTHKNIERFEYDEQLIDNYKESRNSVEKEKNNFIIFHLNGQHVDPATKFPATRAKFTTQDYAQRNELSEAEKQEVANYDNATLYNDSIVNEIINMYREKDAIVIYFADHGDEANDYRSHVGRCPKLDALGAPSMHCQLDIPFLIYMSDTYQEKHPDVAEQVKKATQRPFMTDDLPHLLIDLAGVQNKWYNPKRNIINDSFDIDRVRLIRDWGMSSPIDYDSVCASYGNWEIGWTNTRK